MLGTIVNTITVILGSFIGLCIKKGIPERLTETLMQALGLCTLFIGIQGAFNGENTLIMIISMVFGTFIGELLDIDKHVNVGVKNIEDKVISRYPNAKIAEGFINACMLFCIGSMTIVGTLNAGLLGDCTMLYTKSTLDFFSSIVFASTMGIGVLLSAIFVFVYQGSLTLLAGVFAPLLSMNVINEMTCVGSLVIIALGLNLLGITKLKVMNMIPGMFIPMILCLFM